MSFIIKRFLAGIAVLLVASIGISQAADINLRAVVSPDTNDEDYDGIIVFKDFVEAQSNGKISVEIFANTSLCKGGAECLQALSDGTIDIFMTTSGGAAGVFPYVQVFDLPYLMSSDRVAEHVLTGDFMYTIRDWALQDSGGNIRLMTIGNTGGWRNFANTKRVLKTPSDFKGLKIRTVVADLPQVLVKAFGASPTPIPWPELFTSFQTGVVEGSKNGITDIMGMKFPDAGLKYVTLDGHAYMGALWWINNNSFKSLDAGLQKVVTDGFYALQQATFASPKRKSIQAYKDFVDGGGSLYVPTPEQKKMYQTAAAPTYDWFKENIRNGPEVFALLQEKASEAEAEIAKLNALAAK